MGDAVRKLEPTGEVAQDFATVIDAVGAELVVESEWGRRRARRAPSCLLEPRPGDRVLVVERGPEAYVLGVLASDAPNARVSVEGDLELSVPSGSFRVAAAEGVEIASSHAIQMLSEALKVRAVAGEILVERLAVAGKELIGEARVAKLVTGTLTSFVERLQQHVKRSFRTVEEADQLRAKRIDYRSEEDLTLRGKHAFVHADELVKMTGEQIHMG